MTPFVQTGISGFTVFLEGLLSFFSPCVLPLVPIYIGYLAGGAKKVEKDGSIRYPRKKVLINTVFFVIGTSFAFFLLGFGFSALGHFFSGNRIWFARIAGIIMILFGIYQLGFFGSSNAIETEHRLPFRMKQGNMNPIIALLLGFTFSFAWTPCVGPMLASVLLMASSSGSAAEGFSLIGLYTIGFILPFLAVGFFTGAVLNFFRKHQSVVRYTVKIGGILLIVMGVFTLTGWMQGFHGMPNASNNNEKAAVSSQIPGSEKKQNSELTSNSNQRLQAAPDFKLKDQFGKMHTLSEYKGKTIFINFWATWCGPCRSELPDIQKIYQEYGKNQKDIIILGIANPKDKVHTGNSDGTVEEVKQFLKMHNYSYPVLMDITGNIFQSYGIMAFPTTFIIDEDGNISNYITGALTEDMMKDIIQKGTKNQKSNNK